MARHTKDIGIISITTIKLAKGMPESSKKKSEKEQGDANRRDRGGRERWEELESKSLGSAALEQCFLAKSFAYFCAQTHTHTRRIVCLR